jgi:hypothetical protein
MIGWMIAIFLFVSFVWTGFVGFSIHWERLKIRGALDSLKEVRDITSQYDEDRVRDLLRRKLYIDGLNDTERLSYYQKLFKVDNSKEGEMVVSIKFEVRQNLVWGYELTRRYHEKVKIVSRNDE